jgi:ribosomal protein L1
MNIITSSNIQKYPKHNIYTYFSIPKRSFASPAATAASATSKLSGTAKAKLEKERRAKKRKAKAGLLFKTRSGPTFHIDDAINLVRAAATARFTETIDVQIQLAVDPRKPNQNIRGIAQLPHGTGKKVEILVFAKGEKAEEARKAGATLVGAEDLVEKITKGELSLNFDKTIATPDVMPLVGKVARVC